MECLYFKELQEGSKQITVGGELFKHLKALRLSASEKIMLTNGTGVSAVCSVLKSQNSQYIFNIENYLKNHGELAEKLGLAIGILSDRSRFEFALEKAVELGCSDFYPLITKYTEKKTISIERLYSKAVSAMEQSKRSKLIKIHLPVTMDDIEEMLSDYDNIILAEETGGNPEATKANKSIICLVGPEGGFSDEEISLIKNFKNLFCWNLANSRLRSETAAISALSFASLKINL